jgi:aryl-alcohol dehydrogenase-like predicted oxidoreductase
MGSQGLVLGTVQLGTLYGIANRAGMPDEAEALAFIAQALEAGISCIDTARAYGESEVRLGKALATTNFDGTIITKISPLGDLGETASSNEIEDAVRKDVETSLTLLGQTSLGCLLLHRAEHLTQWNGKVWSVLQALVNEGKVGCIGASVQSVGEARSAFETPDLGHIQLPVNPLDYRWSEAGIDTLARAHPDITVHARSLYLQGLLATGDPALFPKISGLDAIALVKGLKDCMRDFGRSSLADLCLAWARSLDWVDGFVIGMETPDQLHDNLKLFDEAPLTRTQRAALETSLPRVPETLLNPALWP